MRTLFVSALVLVCLGVRALAGQQGDASLDRIRAALSATANSSVLIVTEPPEKSWKGMTLVQPDLPRGQFVQMRVPVGEYVMKATRAVSKVRHERAQRKAHDEVDRALQEFMKQQK